LEEISMAKRKSSSKQKNKDLVSPLNRRVSCIPKVSSSPISKNDIPFSCYSGFNNNKSIGYWSRMDESGYG